MRYCIEQKISEKKVGKVGKFYQITKLYLSNTLQFNNFYQYCNVFAKLYLSIRFFMFSPNFFSPNFRLIWYSLMHSCVTDVFMQVLHQHMQATKINSVGSLVVWFVQHCIEEVNYGTIQFKLDMYTRDILNFSCHSRVTCEKTIKIYIYTRVTL